jgi:hypothetical protein
MAIAACAVYWIYTGDVSGSVRATMTASEIAFNLSVQILGFLIGGFAIFATVTDDRLMIRLAQAPMPRGGLSVFKYVFFSFLSVFYIYIVTLGFSTFVKLCMSIDLVDTKGLMSRSFGPPLLAGFNAAVFSVLAGCITLAVVRLKSFIWNIYQGFITFLSVSEMMEREREKPVEDQKPPSQELPK